jgi:hypothetical protein
MEKRDIIKKINLSLDLFYEKDAHLIEINVHERSIAHKFAEYLQLLFPDYNVDCEYDRHGKYTKKLERIKECDKDRTTNRILPDIIIHKRGHDRNNLVVFEVKSKSTATACDIKKLELLTKKLGEFGYDFGFFVQFGNERAGCELRLFINGIENGI